MSANRPLIIAAAINGSRLSKSDNPAVPYTAREIANEIVAAARAGAAMAHVHARTPDGQHTQDVNVFREIVERVSKESDIILELSLGGRGLSVEESLAPLVLKPLMGSFPMEVRKDSASGGSALEETALTMVEQGVRPSLAMTTSDSRDAVLDLVRRGLVGTKPCITVSVDPFSSLGEATRRLVNLTSEFPENVHWWFMKGGKSGAIQYALRALAIGLGGHVRVGFEDRIKTYDDLGFAPSNAWFVERMVELARATGRPIATPADAKRLLALG